MVGWHPSKEVLVSASYDDTVRTWEADEDDWSPAQILDSHSSTVWAFSFNQSGEHMATAGDDATIRFWCDANGTSGNTTKYQEEAVLRGFHSRAILSIDWLRGLEILASAVSSLSRARCRTCAPARALFFSPPPLPMLSTRCMNFLPLSSLPWLGLLGASDAHWMPIGCPLDASDGHS